MFINTKYRTDEPETMDDFTMEGEILRDALDKIAKINQLLGGNLLTLRGVQDLIKDIPKSNEISIVDVGCGNGDMLRTLADFGLKNNLKFQLIGIDANNFTINHARKLSKKYSNISYQCEDIFDKPFGELKYDIILCTLTLHHFKDNEIIYLLNVFNTNSNIGIVINDLQRSAVAYRLFQALCFVFRLNDMSREDGLISILRGFKKEELVSFSEKLNFSNYKIHWKWAFRYQWIISKI
ncbi:MULTISPECIES: methyltransferase domain-containing protein [Flavobacterium]|uniref:Methyltransferase domain-containing protein n=1 Tax=Flavobacterium gawalongense TaxID=2594432 RepID=A0A553BEL8_9FLAO|nr:methyltransferase domain-containing protein [Flavobacterium gawalongense]TRW99062.1 methyltransferase domain-containing protein [Flavobacterium gawalongense]TRX03816.1 methyltransferase domain-containing protein [Flavobacterium gawalongense]TRX06703.1 methyltransferase domain-containing protein [Flavobacterium gawalongense]TRX07600.1 methyltransferase domain-containing protein [Flavobacterium gawalongense]TRX23429.1 methyltransferase domain-containing protein [Flavobacterium gawalongense]